MVEEPARRLLAVVIEELLAKPPAQVKVEALVEVSALELVAMVMEALRAESPAKELQVIFPTMVQVLLLQVVLRLVAWEVVPTAVQIQVSSHPAVVIMPKNQTQRRLPG